MAKFQGIIKGITIKSNDVDKWAIVKIELQNSDINALNDLMLKAVNIEITPNEA